MGRYCKALECILRCWSVLEDTAVLDCIGGYGKLLEGIEGYWMVSGCIGGCLTVLGATGTYREATGKQLSVSVDIEGCWKVV